MTAVVVALSTAVTAAAGAAEGPSFDCRDVSERSMVELICSDQALAALDRRLAEVYARALLSATAASPPPVLKTAQRAWITQRDDCWKSAEQRQCVATSYRQRIAELEARYELVPVTASVNFICAGSAHKPLRVRYFATEPATALAEFEGTLALLYQAPAGSGIHYLGPTASLREHHGTAMIRWGEAAPEMRCAPRTH